MVRSLIKNMIVMMMVLVSLLAVQCYAQDSSESAKINYLITSVEALEGATFIRNGSEYDAQSASKHLRLKLKVAGGKVKTAEDFINLCASKSSMTGEPYLIKFADGTTVQSERFFRDRLKAFVTGKS
jgi:hypothetical protein